MKRCLLLLLLGSAAWAGCGTTRWSDTQRTATEQLLISDAIDRSVSKIDFSVVTGKNVYLDNTYIKQTLDAAYLISTMRQHLLAAGCIVKEKAEEADYVVEVRTGAVGTDRHDLLFGIPATGVSVPVAGAPTALPQIPLATKTEQRAVAKIAVFAYNRRTGSPIYQSGVIPVESKVKDLWVFGTGPFQSGSIYSGTRFAGQKVKLPQLGSDNKKIEPAPEAASVAREAYYPETDIAVAEKPVRLPPTENKTVGQQPKQPPDRLPGTVAASLGESPIATTAAEKPAAAAAPSGVIAATHTEPIPASAPDPAPPASGTGAQAESPPKMPNLEPLNLPSLMSKARAGTLGK
jgi:hypothetical protein